MNDYQSYIAISRYARFRDTEKRRETWEETVARYCDYFANKFPSYPRERIYNAIIEMKCVPSMRALMTAGPALERDPMAGYNCAAIAMDDTRAFDEAMYVLMCFHPDTMVVTHTGNKRIVDIQVGDKVMSQDETTGMALWKPVTNHVKTKSVHKPKVVVVLDNGHEVRCTADHKWLTTNRGYVEAKDLTTQDDLVSPNWKIYRITNTKTNKCYVGQTSKNVDTRFREHLYYALYRESNWHFSKALRKYREEVWKIEVIDFAFSNKEAHEKESLWIAKEDSLVNGYNSTIGGEGCVGYVWTEEQRKAASENAYERSPEHRDAQRLVLAKAQEKIIKTRQTQEYREAQRARNLGSNNPMYGKTASKKRRAQISLQVSGEGNPFFGKKHSDATKAKISASRKNKAVMKGASA